MAPSRPDRGVLQLAAPLVLSFLLRDAFGWVDLVFASGLSGEGDVAISSGAKFSDVAIAAIGLAAPFQFLMIACWVGSSNALTSRMSAAMGAGQDAKVEQLLASARRVIFVLVGVFLALAAGIWLGLHPYDLEPELDRQFRIYATVLIAGSSLTTFWSILPDSIVKAHHDTRSTMWAGIASSVLNVALNALFVFVFGWGVLGIALATVLGRFGGLAYALRKASAHERERRAEATRDDPTLFARPVHALLALAVPSGLSFVLLAFEGFALNAFLTKQEGSTPIVAAFSLLDRSARTLTMPMITLGVAMLPLAARLWGRRDVAGIRRELRTGLRAAAIYGVLILLPIAVFVGPLVADALLDSEPAARAGRLGFRWLWLVVLLGGPMFLLRSTFEGLQRPLPGLAGSAVRALVLYVPLGIGGYLAAPHLGLAPIQGLLVGMALGAGLASFGMWTWLGRMLGAAGAERQSRET